MLFVLTFFVGLDIQILLIPHVISSHIMNFWNETYRISWFRIEMVSLQAVRRPMPYRPRKTDQHGLHGYSLAVSVSAPERPQERTRSSTFYHSTRGGPISNQLQGTRRRRRTQVPSLGYQRLSSSDISTAGYSFSVLLS